jgi:hypothetical protein
MPLVRMDQKRLNPEGKASYYLGITRPSCASLGTSPYAKFFVENGASVILTGRI